MPTSLKSRWGKTTTSEVGEAVFSGTLEGKVHTVTLPSIPLPLSTVTASLSQTGQGGEG